MSLAFDDLFQNRVEKLNQAQHIIDAEEDGRVLDRQDPRQWATIFALKRLPRLLYHHGVYYDHSIGAYKPKPEDMIESIIAEFLSTCYVLTKKEVHVPFKPTKNTKAETVSALKNLKIVDPSERTIPFWLDREDFIEGVIHMGADGNPLPTKELVSFPNGILHVPTGSFFDPTPKLFTFTRTAFDYDPAAPKPKLWMEFLHQLWPDDKQARECLMQYVGYLLSGDTSLQKILMIVGPPGSGKSTLLRVMSHVAGEENVVWTDAETLSEKFGLEIFTGKTIAFLPDESFDYRTCKVGIDRLRRISGCDAVSIRRMHKKSQVVQLPVRFVISTNEIPRLRGSAAAMARRFVILRTPSFDGKVDPRLTERLCNEAPGIMNVAIASFRDLLNIAAEDRFTQPESGKADIEELYDLGSTVSAFTRDSCEIGDDKEIETDVLYIHYREWADAHGEHKIDAREFGRQLRVALPHVRKAQRRTEHGRHRVYEGITVSRG